MRAHLTSTFPLCAALALAVAAPAVAQVYADETPAYVDEVVVTGPLDRDGGPARLSRIVSIRDLDLATREDQALLRLRIRDTARDLCRELGESDSTGSPIIPSCVDQAVREARPQMRVAINQAYDNARYASLTARDPYAPLYPY